MINLLSQDLQTELRSARLNVRLRSYIVVTLAVLLATLLVFAASLFLSYQQRAAAEQSIDNNLRAISQYSETRKEAENFHKNLATAKSILTQETLYSDLMVRIAKTLPTRTNLTDLTLSEEIIAQPIILNARVGSQQAAVTLKNTLEESEIFSDVSLISVQSDGSSTIPDSYRNYPVSVTLQASFNKPATTREGDAAQL